MDAQQISIDTSVTFPDAVIPGLEPYGLERVPGWRAMPGVTIPTGWRPTPGEPGFEDPTWRTEHKAWAAELRDTVRPWIHAKGNRDPEFAQWERDLCGQDFNYFGAVYGWIQDPQPLPDEEQDKPYAKFAYQCDNTTLQQDWIYRDRREKAKIRRSKSRQLGISWDDEHFDTAFYLFAPNSSKALLVSRNERWVDNGLSTEAMFGKIKYILRKLSQHTPYLLPPRHSVEKLLSSPLYRDMVLHNPASGTELVGATTTKMAGRGGTYTYGRADEDAFIRNLEDVLTSMQGACPRIFTASTESFEMGFEHWDGWQAAKNTDPSLVREYNWHQNAYLDLAWEQSVLASLLTQDQKQKAFREYFRDPFAGFGAWVYPEARNIPDVHQPYRPQEPLDITMDPAGTGDDLALMACQPTALDGNEGFHILWSYERRLPNPERIAHIATGIWPEHGDACEGWQPDHEEHQIGAFLYDCWLQGREVRWFMDPAGDQFHSRASFVTMFRDKTKELRQREYERLLAINIALEERGKAPGVLPIPKMISPRYKAIKVHRLFADREFAFRRYLPFVTCQTGVLSAGRVRECAGKSSYNDLAAAAVTDPKRKHDQYSHLTSCLENYSLYYYYRFIDPLDSKEMRKLQRGLGLRGPGQRSVPSGFGSRGAIPSGFGVGRSLPGTRAAPPGLSSGGWR